MTSQNIFPKRDDIGPAFKAFRKDFIAEVVPPDSPSEVSRVAGKFALVAFAGKVATQMGILPWPDDEARSSGITCFNAWHSTRAGTGSSDMERAIATVRTFIATQGDSRFTELSKTGGTRSFGYGLAGYWELKDGIKHFLVLGDVFRDEVCKQLDHAAIARELANRGHLIPGTDKGKLTTKISLTGTRIAVYRILGSVLEE